MYPDVCGQAHQLRYNLYNKLNRKHMFKKFLLKKMMKSQLKDMPKDQADMLMGMVEKNPDLFMKIAKETQELIKEGKDQMVATMEVSKKYEKELQQMMR